MSQGGEGGGKAGCGAAAAALLAMLGIGVARGADDCAMVACRSAGSSADNAIASGADDVARLGRYGGAGAAAGDESLGLGRLGNGSDDLAGLGAGSSDDLARLGLAAGDESWQRRLAEELVETGAEEVTWEVVEWAADPNDVEDEGEDEAGPTAMTVDEANRLLAQITVRDPRMLVWVPAGSTLHGGSFRSYRIGTRDVGEAVADAALAHLDDDPGSRPLVIAGVSRDDGASLTLGDDRTAAVNVIHRRCWDLGRACIVIACTPAGDSDTGDACLLDAATIFTGAIDQTTTQTALITRLLDLRRTSSSASRLLISRIIRDRSTPHIILSRQN